MNRQVSDTVAAPVKKARLWTPWGSQHVPDADRAPQTVQPRSDGEAVRRRLIEAIERTRG